MSGRGAVAASLPEAHHPDPERLALHASGQLRPIERVILEAHLALCPPCTERLRELLDPGAMWLAGLERLSVPAAVWTGLADRLDLSPPPAAGPSGAAGRSLPSTTSPDSPPFAVPAQAWEELDPRPELRWRKVPTSRARVTLLASDPVLEADLVLVGSDGGDKFPEHVHIGYEDIVVLTGAYRDPFGHFEAGAYYRYPPGSEHGPVIDRGEYCWSLGLIERGLRFRGVLGVLQWLSDPRARRAGRSTPAAGRP
jgi:predicted ChrR family anti-sigma factor